ncbi:uncharacterized protein METZ01_LOCUS212124, partial [marine metagenome]
LDRNVFPARVSDFTYIPLRIAEEDPFS